MHFAFPPEGFAADVLTDRSPSWFLAQAMSNYFLNNKQSAAQTTSPHPCGCPQGGERRAARRQQCSQGCSFARAQEPPAPGSSTHPSDRPRVPGAHPAGTAPACPAPLVCFHTSPCNAQTPPPEPPLLSLPPFLHPRQLGCSAPCRGDGAEPARWPWGPWRCQQLVGHGCKPASGPAGGRGAGTMK